MRLRTLLLAACLVALPLSSSAFADDGDDPPSRDMGESPVFDPSKEPANDHDVPFTPAMGDASNATADGDDASVFDGSTPQDDASDNGPHDTVVEPNGDPQ